MIAERTVGGIKKGSMLPAGLTFTLFVEWLLHGENEPVEDVDPSGTIELNTDQSTQMLPVEEVGEHEAELRFTITKPGTAQPKTVCFYSRPLTTSGAVSPRDTFIYSTPYVEGQMVYYCPIQTLPSVQTEYYATMDFKRQHAQTDGQIETDKVPYIPETHSELNLYFGPVPLGAMPETTNEIKAMEKIDLNSDESKAALGSTGLTFSITCDQTGNQTYFVAIPTKTLNSITVTESGLPSAFPATGEATIIDGINYTKLIWIPSSGDGFWGTGTFTIKNA